MDLTGPAVDSQNSPMRHSSAANQSTTATSPQPHIHATSLLASTTLLSATASLSPRRHQQLCQCHCATDPYPHYPPLQLHLCAASNTTAADLPQCFATATIIYPAPPGPTAKLRSTVLHPTTLPLTVAPPPNTHPYHLDPTAPSHQTLPHRPAAPSLRPTLH